MASVSLTRFAKRQCSDCIEDVTATLNSLVVGNHYQGIRNIAKNQNTFAKRKREMDKKLKAEAKREKRMQRKKNPEEVAVDSPEALTDIPDDSDQEGTTADE